MGKMEKFQIQVNTGHKYNLQILNANLTDTNA